jgi:hypothetical protein
MSRAFVSKSGSRPVPQDAVLERHTLRFLELRRDLEQIEYFCKGTVLKRMMKCGKAQCACASDATKRHGPYFELTYKANGKTVNIFASCDQKEKPGLACRMRLMPGGVSGGRCPS